MSNRRSLVHPLPALPGRGGCLITPDGGVGAAAPIISLNNLKSKIQTLKIHTCKHPS